MATSFKWGRRGRCRIDTANILHDLNIRFKSVKSQTPVKTNDAFNGEKMRIDQCVNCAVSLDGVEGYAPNTSHAE